MRGFSFKRAIGISDFKARVSRRIGVPITRSGRQRKAGAGIGCLAFVVIQFGILTVGLVVFNG